MSRLNATMDGRIPPMRAELADIIEEKPKYTRTVTTLPGGGSFVSGETLTSRNVRLKFLLTAPTSDERRADLARLTGWCGGSRLMISTRKGQFLRVHCTEWPEMSSVSTCPAAVEAVLTAYSVPWWEAVCAVTRTTEGADVHTEFPLPGDAADAPVSAKVENSSGSVCNVLAVLSSEASLLFTGLGLADGETLEVCWDERGMMSLEISGESGTRSAFSARSLSSDDELRVRCGRSGGWVGVYASVPVKAVFSGRGRFL